jgi:hypothetical protein
VPRRGAHLRGNPFATLSPVSDAPATGASFHIGRTDLVTNTRPVHDTLPHNGIPTLGHRTNLAARHGPGSFPVRAVATLTS